MLEKGAMLLHWHYMIFLLPMGLAALFLLLSSLRLGGRHGHRTAAQGRGHSAGHRGHTAATARHSGAGKGQHTGKHSGPKSAQKTGSQGHSVTPITLILALIGADRAPLPLALELFCLSWGIGGFWVNRLLLPDHNVPSLLQMLPSLFIALIIGIVGARLGSEMAYRLMPREETTAVSRGALFGLTGTVVFAVSETAGRIHVYDDHGTLHDESCRIATGKAPIAKGDRAMVLDVDSKGRLIVEVCSGV